VVKIITITVLETQHPESTAVDVYISSINPSLNFANNQYLQCGCDSVGAKYRTLIKPTDVSSLPGTAQLLAAEIRLYCNLAGSGIYGIHEILQSWPENVSWSGQPGFDPIPIETVNITGVVGQWYVFNILDLVKYWMVGAKSNYGILIKAQDETIVNNISFCSSNYSNSGARPIYYFEYILKNNKRKPILLEGGLTL
jgi:hypothetical protein